MTVRSFQFDPNFHAAFIAQTRGVDPYTPGKRCRAQLADILGWGLDVDGFRDAVRNDGAALLTGLPVDTDLPLSPPFGKRPTDKPTVVSECLLNGVSQVLGLHPVAFHNEKGGDLIHQITPVPGREASFSNQGANQFAFHTEGTHLPTPPDVLALVCVRNTELGGTNFVLLNEVMRGASPEIIAELRRDAYTLPVSESYGQAGQRYSIPLIKGPEDAPLYRVDFTDIEGTDRAARHALAWYQDAVRMAEQFVRLQPGQMVVLNNHRALHGRMAFTPDYSEGKARWLQRQYMTANPLAGAPGDPRYPHVWNADC